MQDVIFVDIYAIAGEDTSRWKMCSDRCLLHLFRRWSLSSPQNGDKHRVYDLIPYPLCRLITDRDGGSAERILNPRGFCSGNIPSWGHLSSFSQRPGAGASRRSLSCSMCSLLLLQKKDPGSILHIMDSNQ